MLTCGRDPDASPPPPRRVAVRGRRPVVRDGPAPARFDRPRVVGDRGREGRGPAGRSGVARRVLAHPPDRGAGAPRGSGPSGDRPGDPRLGGHGGGPVRDDGRRRTLGRPGATGARGALRRCGGLRPRRPRRSDDVAVGRRVERLVGARGLARRVGVGRGESEPVPRSGVGPRGSRPAARGAGGSARPDGPRAAGRRPAQRAGHGPHRRGRGDLGRPRAGRGDRGVRSRGGGERRRGGLPRGGAVRGGGRRR